MEVDTTETSNSFNNKIDPTAFDVTIEALLIGIGADKYIPIFRKLNIGQCTLMELNDEDLIKLGIDEAKIRNTIIDEVKNFPIYQEKINKLCNTESNLGPMEIIEVLEESSQHLYRLYLSTMANNISLKKSKKVSDCLIHEDKYASDVCLCTLNHMNNLLNSMDIALRTKFKGLSSQSKNTRNRKIVVGTIGTLVVGVLSVLFMRSLKHV